MRKYKQRWREGEEDEGEKKRHEDTVLICVCM